MNDDIIGWYVYESQSGVWLIDDVQSSMRLSAAAEFSDREDAEQMRMRAERHNPEGTFYVLAMMGSR